MRDGLVCVHAAAQPGPLVDGHRRARPRRRRPRLRGRRERESAPWPSGRRYHASARPNASLQGLSRFAAALQPEFPSLRREHTTVSSSAAPSGPNRRSSTCSGFLSFSACSSRSCAQASARQQTARTGRPDGRLLPDGADIQRTTPASRPDDRGDRFTPGASSEPAVFTGRPDGRTAPDAVDARNTVTPVVISAGGSGTTSFDWLAALIGGLTVGGLALATGGLFVLRHHRPDPRSLTVSTTGWGPRDAGPAPGAATGSGGVGRCETRSCARRSAPESSTQPAGVASGGSVLPASSRNGG